MKNWLLFLILYFPLSIFSQEEWLVNNEIQLLNNSVPFETKKKMDTWPFQLKGGLILVEAYINDQRNRFLLDSGAPSLFINGQINRDSSTYSAIGMNGALDIVEKKISSFRLGNFHQKGVQAFQMDISHLEEAKSCKMAGIIGYDQIKDHEILIDYKAETLSMVEPGSIHRQDHLTLLASIPFTMYGHFAVVKVDIAGTTYNLGIDTGAESNVLNKKCYKELKANGIEKTFTTNIRGIDQNLLTVVKCEIGQVSIEGESYHDMNFVFTNLNYLNEAYGIELHGLLGFPFLKSHLYSINYKDQKLCFWEKRSR